MSSFVFELFTLLSVWLSFLYGYTEPPQDLAVESFATTSAVVIAVIDGDTIEVQIASTSQIERVRYIGINTPELHTASLPECGSLEAVDENRILVEGKTVMVVPGRDPRDDYGRLLAYVYYDSIFINEALIERGMAKTMMISPNTDFTERFMVLERQAKQDSQGNWERCNY